MKIESNKNMKEHNTFRLDITVRFFVEVEDPDEFQLFFTWMKEQKVSKFFVIGECSNVIFKDSFFNGVVVKITYQEVMWDTKSLAQVEVGAGKNMDEFLQSCQERGFFDIQSLSSIPGSVGAGVLGNIGAFGVEIKSFVSGVWVFDRQKDRLDFIDSKDLDFSYRDSFLKQNRERFVVSSVVFDFSDGLKDKIRERYKQDEYFDWDHFKQKHDLGNIGKSHIRTNIQKIREGVYPDIQKFPNVGSTFKNTLISQEKWQDLLEAFPNMPNWVQKSGEVKVPTAYIFDKVLNLNGQVLGNIQVDHIRPLFFINLGGASGKEFYDLCQEIKKRVKVKIGVDIKEEVFFID